ncbi:polysialyltransferase family glycosyltransferase [Succinivibrio dextrinosolvens]|uniref:polysialyltransferase family glycosyltransferase n=1 Tax=Succinivibrio dextrinosolvens TaxID=83771 RepID=UPI0013E927DC|nr:polysialyltransferase family glycosyltransferase [Succinivibrio dextrinosolvens]
MDLYTHSLFATLVNTNPNIKCIRFEEGILSYNFPLSRRKSSILLDFLRKFFLRKPILIDRLNDFYCFFPELYEGKLRAHKIPKIDTKELKPIIDKLFDIDLSVYKYKYIFFTSVYDFDVPKPIGEFEVLKKIRDLVGNDNLLVKVHPRDRRNIYSKEGFHLDPNTSVPWEAILICAKITSCIFLSVNSSCLFSSKIINNSAGVSAFVYPLCNVDNDPTAIVTVKNIQYLLKNTVSNNWGKISVVEKIEDVLTL